MRVPLEWLKQYVDIELSAGELADKLTMIGITSEGIEEMAGDQVLILELTPNRGDCYGLINLAREVAALTGKNIRIPQVRLGENQEDAADYIRVDIAEPELCGRYAARVVKNINIAPSPDWMQSRLLRAGVRPINNIVDVTNYVMLETNQPLHAFDYDLLEDAHIIVRRANRGEKMVTLDDVERELDDDMLVIADSNRAVALAGVMGGQNSEINENTHTMLLESANFAASSVRKTSRRLALRTEASIRFEKGVDPEGVVYAINRAAQLIEQLGAGEVVRGVVDEYPGRQPLRVINLRPARVNWLLGTWISAAQIKEYLEGLGFSVSEQENSLEVTVPSYRPDIELEADLIEEVARMYGYNNIGSTLPRGSVTRGGLTPRQRFQEQVAQELSRFMNEMISYSFINPRSFDWMCLEADDPLRNVVRIANPLSEEQSVMRTTLVPGMLDTVSRNLARRNENMALFEVGAVFYPREDDLPVEDVHIGGVVAGKTAVDWQEPSVDMDFFYLKGILEEFLVRVGVQEVRFAPVSDHPTFHPGRTALLRHGETRLGLLGEIHPQVLDKFEIKKRVCVFELALEPLFRVARPRRMVEEIARYPAVTRDLALLVPEGIAAEVVTEAIQAAGGEMLKQIKLFDVYQGVQVPGGFKSMAYALTFRSAQETLQDEQVNEFVQSILAELERKVGAKLR